MNKFRILLRNRGAHQHKKIFHKHYLGEFELPSQIIFASGISNMTLETHLQKWVSFLQRSFSQSYLRLELTRVFSICFPDSSSVSRSDGCRGKDLGDPSIEPALPPHFHQCLAPKSRINGSLDCNHSSAAYLHSNVTGQSKTPIEGDPRKDIFCGSVQLILEQKWLLFDGKRIENQRGRLHWLYSWNYFVIETMSWVYENTRSPYIHANIREKNIQTCFNPNKPTHWPSHHSLKRLVVPHDWEGHGPRGPRPNRDVPRCSWNGPKLDASGPI